MARRNVVLRSPGNLRQRKYPANSGQPTIYAIGDVHGRLDLLKRLHDAIDQDWAGTRAQGGIAVEIYLGDAIDRGPNSAGVIEELLKRRTERHCVFILGNHEAEFIRVLAGSATPEQVMHWLRMGGATTAMSYGAHEIPFQSEDGAAKFILTLGQRVPETHRWFLHNYKLFYVIEPYLFVHAGIRPGVPLTRQSNVDLLSIRDEFLLSEEKHEHIVVHGHTPVMSVQLLANRINVDTGAFATNRLSCVRLDNDGTATVLPQ